MNALSLVSTAAASAISSTGSSVWAGFFYVVKQFYLFAPLRIGGWEGAEYADVCAHLTTIPSAHWMATFDRQQECARRIARD